MYLKTKKRKRSVLCLFSKFETPPFPSSRATFSLLFTNTLSSLSLPLQKQIQISPVVCLRDSQFFLPHNTKCDAADSDYLTVRNSLSHNLSTLLPQNLRSYVCLFLLSSPLCQIRHTHQLNFIMTPTQMDYQL